MSFELLEITLKIADSTYYLQFLLTILHCNILQFNNILLANILIIILNNYYKLINIFSQKYNLFDTLYYNIIQPYIIATV